jgi:hypothetical protein
MANNKAGRPTKKTPEIVDILLKCFRLGLHVETACAFAKINKTSFYTWLRNDPDFSTQVDFSKSQVIIELTQEVRKQDAQGPWKLLKNLAPNLYKDRIETEHVGKDGGPIEIKARRDKWREVFKDPKLALAAAQVARKLYGDDDDES